MYINHLVEQPYMCCLLIPKSMSQYRRKISDITPNDHKNKRRLSIGKSDEVNYDIVSVPVDGSREYLGQHKGIPRILNFFSGYQ